jgi:hypothetical protein
VVVVVVDAGSAVCAGMVWSALRVTLSALTELHQLLTERDFRRSSLNEPTIVQEEQHEEPAGDGGAIREPAPTQRPVRFGRTSRLRGVTPAERQIALARMACC